MAQQQRGHIARIISEKGFGFIREAGTDVEYFFHRSAVKNDDFSELREGDDVTFSAGEGLKGPRAEGVCRV